MAELGLRTGTIVTKNESEKITTDAGTIEVVPAWRFPLDQPDAAEERWRRPFGRVPFLAYLLGRAMLETKGRGDAR